MAIPNTFTNGTVADADEINANFTYLDDNADAKTSETGPYSGSPARTYTVGGISGEGYKLAIFTLELDGGTSGGYIRIYRGSDEVQRFASPDGGTNVFPQVGPSDTVIFSFPVPVSNGDTIVINTNGANLTIKNIKIWCSDGDATFTGS
ncbi:MAG: hypothetical protein ACTSXD_11910 [Candidatus Heimdallarchaeaceae archaeon]